MRLIYFGFFILIACSCIGCGSGKPSSTSNSSKGSATDPQELERLKGTWQVVAIEAAGNPVPAERVQKINLQYVFDDDKLTVRRPDRSDNQSTFSVDTTVNPKKMTFNQTPKVRAAYDLDGNKLRLCLMVDENPNAGYPMEIVSKASPKTDLLTLERR
jgi:uncharacterized protein (TIGR03067 family)